MRSDEGPGDVRMDKTASVGRFVERGIVGMSGGIRRGAGRTAVEATMRKRRWSVRGYGWQSAQSRSPGVNS
eukprot:1590593-Pleurochrysis_carterae.AAC.1